MIEIVSENDDELPLAKSFLHMKNRLLHTVKSLIEPPGR